MRPVSKWLHVANSSCYLIVDGERKDAGKVWKWKRDVIQKSEITLVSWTTRIPLQKLWYIKRNVNAATSRGLILTTQCVWKEKGMMFALAWWLRAKIILSQRTGGEIKGTFYFFSAEFQTGVNRRDIKAMLKLIKPNLKMHRFVGPPCTPRHRFELLELNRKHQFYIV